LTATVTVAGPSGSPTPTGSVVLSGGGYNSAATPLSDGVSTITVPAGTWAQGTVPLLFAYTPDAASAAVYNPAKVGSGPVNVTAPAPPTGSFTVTGTAVSISSPGGSGTSTVAITPMGGFAGTVNLGCSLLTSPSGANATYAPTCSLSSSSVVLSGTAASNITARFVTVAPTSGSLAYPVTDQNRNHWYYTYAGGAALAVVLFFGIPARKKSWRAMLGLGVFIVLIAGAGCGGGGSNGAPGNPGTPGTTAGTYTFTVGGASGPTGSLIQASTTVTLKVQ